MEQIVDPRVFGGGLQEFRPGSGVLQRLLRFLLKHAGEVVFRTFPPK